MQILVGGLRLAKTALNVLASRPELFPIKVTVIRKCKIAAIKCFDDVLGLGNARSRHEDADSTERDRPERVGLYEVGISNRGRDAGSL
jgi:hypothetical protein